MTPTIAPNAQMMPMPSTSVPDTRSSTSTRPTIASSAPATVRGPGRWPRVSHSQPMTATGDMYSISSATPTGIRSTALKNASWHPATASSP